jgi:hypothetical protein
MQNGNGRNRYDYLAVVIVSTVEIKQLVLENVDDVCRYFAVAGKSRAWLHFSLSYIPLKSLGPRLYPTQV